MRAALIATAATIATVFATLLAPVPPSALAGGPSARRIRQAASRAERSSALWATINVCSSKGNGRGGELGVRGQMPTLGFTSTLRMTIRLSSWSVKHRRFDPIAGSSARSSVALGSASSGRRQGGVVFAFTGATGLLSASVDFTWARGGRVIAQAQRATTAGHRDVDFSRPAHYSASRCRLG